MNTYVESKKKIEAIRNKYGEVVFRMGISHLMDVGTRHLTKENVEETCKEIMESDDTGRFMTNAFMCEIVKAAYDLAHISQTDLLVYIQREVEYDVFDGMPSYQRAMDLLKSCMCNIEQWNDCRNELTLGELEDIGFDDDEIEQFGFGYLLDVREEEEVEK